jgi:hypothetical protein
MSSGRDISFEVLGRLSNLPCDVSINLTKERILFSATEWFAINGYAAVSGNLS